MCIFSSWLCWVLKKKTLAKFNKGLIKFLFEKLKIYNKNKKGDFFMAKHQFQTEVGQLLHLMTHSLYSNKEIF